MKLEELMEKYRKTTQEKWELNSDNDMVYCDDAVGSAIADFCCRYSFRNPPNNRENGEFTAAIHNSFPALFNRLRVTEKMIDELSEDLGKVYNDKDDAYKVYRQIALTKLGLTEADIKED